MDNPRGDFDTGVVFRASQLLSRLMHRLQAQGEHEIPAQRNPGSLIIIANHTSGIDPMLIQACCPFEIRWMMAADMKVPILNRFWNWSRVIIVNRFGRDHIAARQALRHLKSGGVLGIFPEGGIERPPEQIMPFLSGVGLLIKLTHAPILPVIITNTPQVDPAWRSYAKFSNSKLSFMPIIHYEDTTLSADQITADLRQRYTTWTSWPTNENPNQALDS